MTLGEKNNRLKKMANEALATLCKSLEAGKSEELRNYLDVLSKFPKYSFRNVLLILKQKPDATQVMGYRSWQQCGRYVKKKNEQSAFGHR